MADTERTLVLVKPDGVARGLVGTVINAIEERGLQLAAAKLMMVPTELAETHYAEHRERPFFGSLVEFITSGPLMALAVEGPNAIKAVRQIAGATNPLEADAASIRGRFAVDIGRNIIHGSDSPESAQRELKLWFDDADLCSWERPGAEWLVE